MHKLFIATMSAGIVLGSGLISCSKEEPREFDVYHPALPIILNGGESVDLQAWSGRKQKELDIHDMIDIKAAAAASFKASSECRVEGNSYKKKNFETQRTRISVWELIEPRLLIELAGKPMECSFEFTLIGTSGSKRMFPPLTTAVKESREGSVRLERAPDDESKSQNFFRLGQAPAVNIRYSNQGPATAQLICSEFTVDSINFHAVMDLRDFDFRKATAGKSFPIQSCRVFVSEGKERVAVSGLMRVLAQERPLLVESTFVTPTSEADVSRHISFVYLGLLYMGWIKVTNPGDEPRSIRILNTRAPATTIVTSSGHGSSLPAPTVGTWRYQKNILHLTYENGTPIATDLTLKARESVTYRISLRSRPFGCGILPVGFSMKQSSPFQIHELNDKQQIVGLTEFFLPPLNWGRDGGLPASPVCDWPDLP